MSCFTIRLLNLSAAAQNRLGTTDKSVLLDVGKSIRLSKDAERLSNVNQILTDGALGTAIPYTPTNDAALLDYQSPVVLDNPIRYYDVEVRFNTYVIPLNRMIVKQKNDKSREYEIELLRPLSHWAEMASNLKINQLDYGVFEMSKANIIANWDGYVYDGDYKDLNTQIPVYFPLVDYGGWSDLTTDEPEKNLGERVKAVGVEDFRPWLSLVYILKAGFCKIGYELQGPILDTDYMKRLWCYLLKPDYWKARGINGSVALRRFADLEIINTTGDVLTADALNWISTGYAAPNQALGIYNYPNIALKYKFKMQGKFHNDRALPFTAVFAVYECEDIGSGNPFFTGEMLSETQEVIEFLANEVKDVNIEFDVILKPHQAGAISLAETPSSGFKVKKGLYFDCTPLSDALMTGTQDVTIKDCVTDQVTLLDVFKGFIHLIDGRIETDHDARIVTVFPNKRADVFTEIVPGFLKEEEPAIDINDIVIPGSAEMIPIRKTLKRYTRYEFADSRDAYIDSLDLEEPAHSRKILNGIDLPDGIEQVQNPLFEPTLEGQPKYLASGAGNRHPLPQLPRLWDNTDNNRSFDLGWRIAYAYGPVRQVNPNPVGSISTLTSFFFNERPNPANTGLTEDFGYVTQLPTWDFETPATVKANVVFGSQPNDLFTAFYLGHSQDTRYGFTLDLLMYIKMRDYNSYSFRQLFTFRHNGVPLRLPMLSIRDFDGCSDISTPVQMLVAPVQSSCCDLPCGCQFTTCDYYFDFGIYMSQSSLNDLKIASFEIDGIEFLTAPVTFGYLKIIDLDGMPYVTNMVDTLNSIGAPYFSFKISSRVHPDKGKRFFTLKRLACVPFKILITNSADEDVYLYSESEQKTKYFGATWANFGYGAETYGAPIDCVTQTEY